MVHGQFGLMISTNICYQIKVRTLCENRRKIVRPILGPGHNVNLKLLIGRRGFQFQNRPIAWMRSKPTFYKLIPRILVCV